MPDKKIEDYLHLYLGSEIYDIETKYTEPLIAIKLMYSRGYDWNKYKLVLRPLSNMTEEETEELDKTEWPDKDDFCYKELGFLWKLKKHFDLFGLIEAGLAIDKTTLK